MPDYQLNVRLPMVMKVYIESIAKRQMRSVSSVVREALLTVMPDDIKAKIWEDSDES